MQGTKLIFESRVPTPEELSTCPHIQMTSSREWEPASVQLGKIHKQVRNENIILSYNGENPLMGEHQGQYMYQDSVFSMDEKILHDVEPSLTMMKERMVASINVEVDKTNDPLSDIPATRTFISTKRHTKATAFNLAERWDIGLKNAENTLKVTTQARSYHNGKRGK